MVLAHILAEDRHPADGLWAETLVSSRLLQYEVWVRLNARGLAPSHGELARQTLARLAFLEMSPPVLARAIESFKVPLRTLDALHLASMEFLREQGHKPLLACYDDRLSAAARSHGFEIAPAG